MKKGIFTLLLIAYHPAYSAPNDLLTNSGAVWAKLIEIFVVLGLILVFIFACAYLLKKTSLVNKQNRGLIKIITSFPLSQKEKLMIIQVGEKQLLLGVTAHSIQTLESFEQPIYLEDGTIKDDGFSDQLRKFLTKEGS